MALQYGKDELPKAKTNLEEQIKKYSQTLQQAGFGDTSVGSLANIQNQISAGLPKLENESEQDYKLRTSNLQQNLSNLSSAYNNLSSVNEQMSSSETAGQKIESNLGRKLTPEEFRAGGFTAAGGYQGYLEGAPLIGSGKSSITPEQGFQFGSTLTSEIENNPAYSQPFDIAGSTLPEGGIQPTQIKFDFNEVGEMSAPTFGADVSAEARARIQAMYAENQKIAAERDKEISLRTGSEINIGQQLEDLRSQNEAFQARLNEELGLSGIDEQIKQLEDRYGLLVDKSDNDFKTQLQDILLESGTGPGSQESVQQGITNLVLSRGQKVEDLVPTTGMETAPTGAMMGDMMTEEPTATTTPSGIITTPTVMRFEEKPTGAVKDNQSGIWTFTDKKTNINFQSYPGVNNIDFSKLTPQELSNLDATTLAYAEYAMFNNDQEDLSTLIISAFKNSQERSDEMVKSVISDLQEMKSTLDEKAYIEYRKQLDDIEIQRLQNIFDEQIAMDKVIESEAKMDTYLRGSLGADTPGGGLNTYSLAIMSANRVKFAKAKSDIATQFSIQDQQLLNLSTYASVAYTNTLRQNTADTTSKISQLTLSHIDKQATLAEQTLITAKEMNMQSNNAKISLAKQIKSIKDAEIEAAKEAAKEASLLANAGSLKTLSDMTGTVWNIDAYGNAYDTGRMTYSAEKEAFSQALDIEKFGVTQQAEERLRLNAIANVAEKIKNNEFDISPGGNAQTEIYNMVMSGLSGFGSQPRSGAPILDSVNNAAFSITPGTNNDIPNVYNNPGNIKAGGVADNYAIKDESGNLVLGNRGEGNFLTFATPEDGFKALLADLQAKQTGNTTSDLDGNSTLLQFAQKYAGSGMNYVDNIISVTGGDANTRIGDIPTELFAKGVAKAEGFNGNIGIGQQMSSENSIASIRDVLKQEATQTLQNFFNASGRAGEAFETALTVWNEETDEALQQLEPIKRLQAIAISRTKIVDMLDSLQLGLDKNDKAAILKAHKDYLDAEELLARMQATETPEDIAFSIATAEDKQGIVSVYQDMVERGELDSNILNDGKKLSSSVKELGKISNLKDEIKNLNVELELIESGLSDYTFLSGIKSRGLSPTADIKLNAYEQSKKTNKIKRLNSKIDKLNKEVDNLSKKVNLNVSKQDIKSRYQLEEEKRQELLNQ